MLLTCICVTEKRSQMSSSRTCEGQINSASIPQISDRGHAALSEFLVLRRKPGHNVSVWMMMANVSIWKKVIHPVTRTIKHPPSVILGFNGPVDFRWRVTNGFTSETSFIASQISLSWSSQSDTPINSSYILSFFCPPSLDIMFRFMPWEHEQQHH